jgi:hypothetical protein
MFGRLLLAMLVACMTVAGFSQGKLSIENVHAAYLRNSGTIMENNRIKGYFFLYQSDRIDRQTNEYTLQILDQNVNKVIDIKFEDTKQLSLLEAAYNNSSLAFLFRNNDNKTLDLKIYDVEGKLKYTYTRSFDKRSDDLKISNNRLRSDECTNQSIFDLGEKGYASVYPVCYGKQISYGVDFYSSQTKIMWTYEPAATEEKFTKAKYLGSTDSLIILQVLKKNRNLSKIIAPHIVGINYITRKKEFEFNSENEDSIFSTTNVINLKEQGKILLMGNYYSKEAKKLNGFSRGIAAYEISSNGAVLSKKYNSWEGRNLFMRRVIQSNGKLFAIAERNDRKRAAATDMLMMELNNEYKVINATVYSKPDNAAYEFTARDADNSNFAVCYSDYVRSAAYKGLTFNSIRYNGEKFVADRIRLKSKASKIHVMPAKMGSVMIMEYFKKTRKLKLRIEKLG